MPTYALIDTHLQPNGDWSIEAGICKAHGMNCITAECITDDEVVSFAKEAEAIGLLNYSFTAELMDRLPKLKMLVRYGIGFDTIDVPAATERGIVVCNLPDYCQPEVATHAFALLMDINRQVTFLDKNIRAGIWKGNDGYPFHRLSCMTIGTFGIGSIARQFVKYIREGYGSRIISYDPYAPDSVFEENGVERVTFDELLTQSDAISIHVPLTEETHNIFNKDTIAKMKDGAYLINTARGPIVNQDDLVAALKSGKIKAAGMDVLEREPVTDITEECYTCNNLLITPHSAYNSIEAQQEQHEKAAISAVEVCVNNIVPYNAINKKLVKKVKI